MIEAIDIVLHGIPYLLAGLSVVALAIAIWSLNWPSVKGRVDVSIYNEEWDNTMEADGPTIEKKGKFFLLYSYSVANLEFQGTRIAPLVKFEWRFSNSSELNGARDDSRWYREGAVVDVYYCPFYPRWSCLEPGGFLATLLLGTLAAIAFFAGRY